jgi:CBS domain-containing protein
MKLTDIITKDGPVLNKNRPLLDALEVLNKQHVESICVDDGGKLVGSISFLDILFRIGTQRLRAVAPESLYISGFMRSFPASTSNDTSIRKAAKLMLELSCMSLPMFYGEQYLGLLHRRSLLRLVQERDIAISTLMRKNFPLIRSHDRVIHARKLLLESGIYMIPALNEDGLQLGVVGQGEVVNALVEFHKYVPEKHQKARIRQLAISAIMNRNVPVVNGSLSLGEAARMILKDYLPGLIIEESSKVVGLLTPNEILEYIVLTFPEEQ